MFVFHRNVLIVGLLLASSAFPLSAMAASTITYTYDAFGQLIAVSSTAGRTVSYSYDAAGNRTNMTATGTTAKNETVPGQPTPRSAEATVLASNGGGLFRSPPGARAR